MSNNTPKLGLFKWNPNTDGAEQFNIDTALNNNWDKVDTFASTTQTTLDTVTKDIAPRLNTIKYDDVALTIGTQTLAAVKRDASFNFTGAAGRLLLNLLGQDGNCESLLPWTFLGGTGVIDPSTKSVGANSLKFTLTDVAGQISKSVNTIAGERYILMADLKVNTASSARVQVSALGTGSNVTQSGGYIRSFMRFIATMNSHTITVSISGSTGNTVNIDAIRLYQVSADMYNAANTMSYSDLGVSFPYTEGLAGVRNPYAIRWDSATSKTEIKSMLAFQTELLADPVSGTSADTLVPGADGQYYRNTLWAKFQLNGTENWTVSPVTITNGKRIEYPTGANYTPTTQYGTRFDVMPFPSIASVNMLNQFFIGQNINYLVTANSDTGWSSSYTPTGDEIRAFILGWKMYDASTNASDGMGVYNRTDGLNKRWTPLASFDGTGYSGNVSTVPVARPEQILSGGYRVSRKVVPYEFMYNRAASFTEAVIFEGQLTLAEGENVIEVGTGIVLREKVTPAPDVNRTSYYINARGTYPTGALQQTSTRPLIVYRNNRLDIWGQDNNGDSSGSRQAGLSASLFDPAAVYTVTYFNRDLFPVSIITGNVAVNEKSLLQDLVSDVQQIALRASVLENRKADKNASSWNSITLLNGWSGLLNFAFRIEGSRIYFRGIISGGLTSPLTQLFVIPAAYATKRAFTATVGTYSGNSTATVALDFFTDGRVQIINSSAGSLTSIAFEGFSYPID